MNKDQLASLIRPLQPKVRTWLKDFQIFLNRIFGRNVDNSSRTVHLRYKNLIRVSCHDLSNQLTLIMGSAQIAQTSGFQNQPEKNLLYWQKIESAAEQLGQLIYNLRAYEAIQEPKRLVIREVKILSLLEELCFSLQEKLGQKNLNLHAQHNLSAETKVLIDPHFFSINCMKKVMGNAIAFAPAHSSIELNSYEKGGLVHIEIRDHGPGISKDIFEKLFQFDFMKEDLKNSGEKGTGFGLSIARLLLQELGGDLKIETKWIRPQPREDITTLPQNISPRNTGTLVTMTIPIKTRNAQFKDEFEA